MTDEPENNMTNLTRRTFMGTTGLGAAGLLLSGDSALGANGDIRIAVAGCGRKSGQHIQIFNSLPGVRVTALCDPDPDCLNRGLSALKRTGRVASGYQDPRRLFEKDGQKVTAAEGGDAADANALIKDNYRQGFEIPESI